MIEKDFVTEGLKRTRIDEYLEDEILRGAAERYLQLAIETCLNIGSRIISLEQFGKSLSIPETYAEVFEVLFNLEILDRDFANKLKNMAEFRNMLLHIYWELDNRMVYKIIVNGLDDLRRFLVISSEYAVK
jgi:uncharacterized protein YutE (UPF0331/DUF86 family)